MNELSILMHLLSRRINKQQIGATEKEICETLNISGNHQAILFHQLILNLSKYVEILGLNIKYNSLDSHWFISFDSEMSDLVKANPFEDKPKLAASLLYIIISCINNLGKTNVSEISKLRKKKGILKDVEELERLGYLLLNKGSGEITLTPLIGYQLDIHKLFINFSLKLREEKE